MAARFVGEAIVSSVIGIFVEKLASTVSCLNLFQRKKLNRKSVEKLETILKEAQRLLNDAERKQIKDDAVKEWLSDLEDAVYVADDLWDRVSTIDKIQKLAGNSESHNYVKLLEREIIDKMEAIIERLELIVKQKNVLGLEAISEENMSWRVTTSLVIQSDIYGRDKDKEEVVKLLLGDTHDGKLSMISIWGMGGIGKTTLAQLVYNDERVKGKFNFVAWVCVGKNLDVFNITKTIIEAITSSSWNTTDLNLLQINLEKKLTGKTFLIVLDDVWSELPRHEWNTLLKPFQYGNNGSKILLTTRNERVSSVMPTVQTHELCSLSFEDCWLVFLKHSFLSIECGEYATLEPIGKKIVEKCKGLPLAAETLGSLLRFKYDIRDWNDILKSEIWEFSEDESLIIPALKLSFHYLPSHLKRCFVFCSVYPQDYKFDKDELILLWMAEGFLQPMKGKTLEQIGCVYFNELVARSFFQRGRNEYGDHCFVMHDLMHDLATFYAKEFYFRVGEHGSAAAIGCKTRHLSCNVMDNYTISKLLTGAKLMRTIFCRYFQEFDMKLISQLKFLRVLLCQFYELDSLPDSIGELIHLRYLDLSYSHIVTLPESLGNMYNLQTLKLYHCRHLKKLPSSMQDLVNLHHLDIGGTYLREMPKGISKLKHLHFLSDYIVEKDEENRRELGALANLHGSLSVSYLKNFTKVDEASEARMMDKKHIKKLALEWNSRSNIAGSPDILDMLRPHSNLEELSINSYGSTIFPDWLGHSSYKNMTNLTLGHCNNCCMLPSLGQLSSLKRLRIFCFDRLQSIGAEFYKSDNESCWKTPFQSLETLTFASLDCLQEWRSFEFGDAFPQLKKLEIEECPVLIGDLPNYLPALEELDVRRDCGRLACPLPRAPAMVFLRIEPVTKLRMQEPPLSPFLLSIKGDLLVESTLEAMTHTQPTCFHRLLISDCDSAVSFPRVCLPSSLQELWIESCRKIVSFPTQWMAALQLQILVIRSCPEIDSFPGGGLPPNLRELRIGKCDKLVSCLASMDLRSHGLTRLHIGSSWKSVKSFPDGGCLPLSLEFLSVRYFRSLETLDCSGLTSLRSLEIHCCDNLENMTGESLPASLTHLDFSSCAKIWDWRLEKDPRIWPKISHIPCIQFNGRRIS